MSDISNRSNMTFILIGFLLIAAIIFFINHYIAKGISETEKQIQYFQSQAGVQRKASHPEASKQSSMVTVGQQTEESSLNSAVGRKSVKTNPDRQEEKEEIIYQPALNSMILVQ